MNRPERPQAMFPIPDLMAGTDERNIAIDQVGIRGLKYPLSFVDADGVAQPTIALANVYVALPEDRIVPPELAPPGLPIQMLELPARAGESDAVP